jgi:hypothetical protein
MMDIASHYRFVGWTREDDEMLLCKHCETEHWFSAMRMPPAYCDVCGMTLFTSADQLDD